MQLQHNNNNNNNNNNSNNNDNNNNNNNYYYYYYYYYYYPVAWKYRVGIRQGIAMSHGQVKCSFALVGNHLETVSQKKYWWQCNLKITNPLMSVKMLNRSKSNNSVKEAGDSSEGLLPGRCPITEQDGPGCN